MDDQFNGRTDDDLFADDFEPVAAPVTESQSESVVAPPAAIPTAPATEAHLEAPATAPAAPSTTTSTPRGLTSSRHATKAAHQARPRKHSPKKQPAANNVHAAQPSTAPSTEDATSTPAVPAAATISTSTSTTAASSSNTTTAASTSRTTGQNTALADRLASGANPRTKPTDTELAEKMERMRILSAEKARKFEQAEQDSRSHAIAYEKGMEEARRRRAEEAERRRKGEEERRAMDQERAANRERKLKALGAKEGGWDEGKMHAEEKEERRGFRGANGGIRGARNTAPAGAGEETVREFAPDEFRGRGRGGRGRGGSRGGRGGRGGFTEGEPRGPRNHHRDGGGGNVPHHQTKKAEQQVPPTADDFPALPPSTAPKLDTSTSAEATKSQPLSISPGLNSPPIGKWDDEMAALDNA
ncbi:hypothetical protein F5Y16DRAFT_381218 [Xylariaceae sp. FL0255]|nr:hypothetical protein F5Y16DRAFT_381218 [Xylariaceae sp. FL0255]